MNCKPGDLAVVVKPSTIENLGKFVTVIEAVGWRSAGEEFTYRGDKYALIADGFVWGVESNTGLVDSRSFATFKVSVCRDEQLRPIRPDGITDEEVRELYAPKLPERLPA